MIRASVFIAAIAALAAGAGAPPRSFALQTAVAFAPHRAVYQVTLERASPSAGIAELSGRMVYEFTGNPCEGYEQKFRYVTVSKDHEGTVQTGDLRSSMWEDTSGDRLRFSVSQYQNNELASETQGNAGRKAAPERLDVELVKPSRRSLAFPGKVFFPMQHSLAVAEAARSGQSFFAADLYDGSEKGDKISHVAAVIGRRSEPGDRAGPPSLPNANQLISVASWPVSVGFFDANSDRTDAVPNAEQSYRFYENGVATDLVSDFGEYALKFDLTELTFLAPEGCPSPKAQSVPAPPAQN